MEEVESSVLQSLAVGLTAFMSASTDTAATLADHAGRSCVQAADIVAALIFRLVTRMDHSEASRRLRDAAVILDAPDTDSEEDDLAADEPENCDQSRDTVAASDYQCNCEVCMGTRLALLNFADFEARSQEDDLILRAIRHTCESHGIKIA